VVYVGVLCGVCVGVLRGVCGWCMGVLCVCCVWVCCVCGLYVCLLAPMHTHYGIMHQGLHFLDSDLFMVSREIKEVRSGHRPSNNGQCFPWSLFCRQFKLHLTNTFVLRRLHNRSAPA
jgi:hypothetical protein